MIRSHIPIERDPIGSTDERDSIGSTDDKLTPYVKEDESSVVPPEMAQPSRSPFPTDTQDDNSFIDDLLAGF